MTNKEEFDRACELLPPGVLWHDPITVDITLEIASKALLRNVSGPMPATASSVPIEQPTSERERELVRVARKVEDWPSVGFIKDLKLALAAYEGEGK